MDKEITECKECIKKSTNININVDNKKCEKFIEKAGCLQFHYKVKYCMNSQKDWRKCQEQLRQLKLCVEKYSTKLHKPETVSKEIHTKP